jgi:hypothetical protein
MKSQKGPSVPVDDSASPACHDAFLVVRLSNGLVVNIGCVQPGQLGQGALTFWTDHNTPEGHSRCASATGRVGVVHSHRSAEKDG